MPEESELGTPGDFEPGFVAGLEQDWQKLEAFCKEWEKVEEDPKLDEFLRRLKTELCDRQINHEGNKLVVFSESKETTGYLLGRLAHAGYKRVLTVSSDTRPRRGQPDLLRNGGSGHLRAVRPLA